MADVQRTRAALLVLFADNVTAQISPQDFRDFVVTVMENEFVNPGDFFSEPQSRYTTTANSGRGWILYSQYMLSACSFGNVMRMNLSCGWWERADAVMFSDGVLALAMNSYAAGDSTAQVLMKGCINIPALSATFSNYMGRAVYLASGASGSMTITATSYMRVLGWVMPSDASLGTSNIGKFFFDPDWAVKLR